MNLNILDGFKTYIVAAAMILAALGQLVGVDIPQLRRPRRGATADGGAGDHVFAQGGEGVEATLFH